MKKLKVKKWVFLMFMLIFLSILIFSGIKIIIWCLNVKANEHLQLEISEYIVHHEKLEDGTDNSLDNEYVVNFDELKKQNSDVVAYLKVNGTNIDYVVVRGKDNNYYLKHNFEKKYNITGWIFADYRNTLDGKDKNIVIFGHNTSNGSMFGTLKNTLTSEWQENIINRKILLITEKETTFYEVFSVYTDKPDAYNIKTNFKTDLEFSNYIKDINKKSIYNFNVGLNDTKQILTLSTCIYNGTKRVLLHAKKVES